MFRGEVVKGTGDGALALLPSADLLVRAGAAIAEAARRNGMALRVGLASGDVVRTDADCFGEAVVDRRSPVRRRGGRPGAWSPLRPSPSGDAATIRALRQLPPRTLKGFDEPLDVHEVEAALAATPSAAVGAPPELVGRSDVLAAITDSWDVNASRPVVLLGEPGIGKTCVAEAVWPTVGSDTIWVSFEPTVSDGFARLCAAIDAGGTSGGASARWPPSAGTASSRAAAHLPSLVDRLPLAPVAPDDDDRTSFFDAVIAVAGALGASPVLVLDDLQWAGGTTIALLQRVATATIAAACAGDLPAAAAGRDGHRGEPRRPHRRPRIGCSRAHPPDAGLRLTTSRHPLRAAVPEPTSSRSRPPAPAPGPQASTRSPRGSSTSPPMTARSSVWPRSSAVVWTCRC